MKEIRDREFYKIVILFRMVREGFVEQRFDRSEIMGCVVFWGRVLQVGEIIGVRKVGRDLEQFQEQKVVGVVGVEGRDDYVEFCVNGRVLFLF